MIALLDTDIFCYRCAAASENDPVEIAIIRLDEMINRVLYELNTQDYKCFLGGKDNYRYDIYPEYKGNRKGKPKPIWLEACREHLIKNHNATIVNGMETDDRLGIEQCQEDLESIIVSIDKDLLQIPGHHYNFVTQQRIFVSPLDALRNYYEQLLCGDGADNIPGFDGMVRGQKPKFVQRLLEPIKGMTEEYEMYQYVHSVYKDHGMEDTLVRNGRLLWIKRKENEELWSPPESTQNQATNEA